MTSMSGLILSVPIIAGFFAFYLKLGLAPDSPTQRPEKLYRERAFFAYALLTVSVLVLLMFSDIPKLYEVFEVVPAKFKPYWHFGR
jgi:decaprenyl-phosphate phosphoribosyltransferase